MFGFLAPQFHLARGHMCVRLYEFRKATVAIFILLYHIFMQNYYA